MILPVLHEMVDNGFDFDWIPFRDNIIAEVFLESTPDMVEFFLNFKNLVKRASFIHSKLGKIFLSFKVSEIVARRPD